MVQRIALDAARRSGDPVGTATASRMLARAETIWVFVDLSTGRRRPIPSELLAAFDPVPDDAEVRQGLGLEG